MCRKFTQEELDTMDHASKDQAVFLMQEKLDKPEKDYEVLIEQIRLANQQRFGRKAEKPDQATGQMPFFNEAEASCDDEAPEPSTEETVAVAAKQPGKPKKRQRSGICHRSTRP